MIAELEIPKRPVRRFLAEDFKVTSWEALKPFFDDLLERKLESISDLKDWFRDRSELESGQSLITLAETVSTPDPNPDPDLITEPATDSSDPSLDMTLHPSFAPDTP